MSKLSIGSITVIVNGYTLNNGRPYFQKAVPVALRGRVGKATIKVPLKPENGNAAVQCHRLNQRYTALFRAMQSDETLAPSEIRLAAHAVLAQAGAEPGQGRIAFRAPPGLEPEQWDQMGHVDAVVDHLQDLFEQPSAVTDAALKAFKGTLPVLLSEAFSVYLENHTNGRDRRFQEAQRQHWDKLVALLGDKAVTTTTRDDARRYRDHRLNCGVTTSTVTREINVIRAVFNKAIREIPLAMQNPFEALSIPEGLNSVQRRYPYTREEVQLLVDAARSVDDEKRRIVLVLSVTGARLAEIVGLRRCDVDLKKKLVLIREHDGRRLKNEGSSRTIPLISVALEALKRQLAQSSAEFVFPCYASADGTNSDSASAALNKWARRLATGKSMHSFRHTLRDELRAARCPEPLAKEIGGWSSSHDVSVGYGLGHTLDEKRRLLTKAYGWLK